MIYEMECVNGHQFERVLPLSQFDFEHLCDCGARAQVTVFPGSVRAHHSFETAGAMVDERIYRAHNITHEQTQTLATGATITVKPNSISDGCKCGNCASHAKRAAVTAVAEPGKSR